MSLVTTFCSRRAASRPDDADERELVARVDGAARASGGELLADGGGGTHDRSVTPSRVGLPYRHGTLPLHRRAQGEIDGHRRPSACRPASTRRPSGRCCRPARFRAAPTSPPGRSAPPARSRSRSSSPGTSLRELPSVEIRTDIHCVTRWSRFDMTFRGVPFQRDRAAHAAAARGRARDQPRRAGLHRQPPVRRDGRRRRDAGLRGRRRAARARARLSAAAGRARSATSGSRPSGCAASSSRPSTSPGFWERYGYHNDADPFLEQRTVF